MIRNYALFSKKHTKSHYVIVSTMVLAIIASVLMLLSEGKLIFSLGLIIPTFPLSIIARASEYKRKYLAD